MSYFATWIALLVCLALTTASSYIPMGAWNTVANMGISCATGILIALFFMHLRSAHYMLRIAAAAGFFWLAILIGLSLTDFAVRYHGL